MAKPYTIRLFVPDGDPSSLKVITKMNWTGTGLELSREAWKKYMFRPELAAAGIYILSGYEGDDLPTIYIGQGDGVGSRIDTHSKNKAFWDKVVVFVSNNKELNKAHITWLEWALIHLAKKANRCRLDNTVTPTEPVLTEGEKADTREFLNEILSILPLVEVKVFEEAVKITPEIQTAAAQQQVQDTVIVPAQEDGFQETFVGENRWYAIRIGGGRLKEIKYIAAYRTAPVSAITHYAEVESIESYGDGGKYQLNFKGPAKQIEPIPFGDAKMGLMLAPRYANFEKLKTAKQLTDLIG
jgi:hypothetical protein